MDIVIKSTNRIDRHLFAKHCFHSCYDKLGSYTTIQTCKVFLTEYAEKRLAYKVDIYLFFNASQTAHFHSSAKNKKMAFDLCIRKTTRFLSNNIEMKSKKLQKLR